MACKGNTLAGCNPPPPPRTVNGGIHFPLAAFEALAKVSHQNLSLLCPTHNKILLHGHRTGDADGMGGIAFSVIWGGDILTPGGYQKFTMTPQPRGQRCLQGKQRALVWANNEPV